MTTHEGLRTEVETIGPPPRTVTRIFHAGQTLVLPPRKWPIQRRASLTVDTILEAAAQLLESDRSISTNAIAARAGVSIGTLYQYFEHKDAVVAALSRKVREALVIAVSRAAVAARGRPLGDGLRLIITAAFAADASRPALSVAIDRLEHVLQLDADHETVRRALRTGLADFLVRQGVEDADRAGVLADDMCAVARALADTARSRGEPANDQLVLHVTRALTALSACPAAGPGPRRQAT